MPHKPFFSLPQESVVERMRNLTADVPKIIRDQAATAVETYLLEQASFLNQQNVLMGGILEEVRSAVYLTNGRVTEQERAAIVVRSELDNHNKFIAKSDANTKRWRRWQQLSIPVATAIFIFILELISKHFNWP